MWDPILDEAIRIAGGPRAFAAMVGIKLPSLYSWRAVPPLRVLKVEAGTGICRTRLRPDLYPPEKKGAPEIYQRVA